MRTGDLCKRQVVTTTPDAALCDVARLMRREHVGSVVVVNGTSPRRPLGIVTDRDIVMEVVAAGLDAATVTAAEIMTPSPAVTHSDDDALWALKTMRDRGVRRLPVVDRDGALAGIVAFDDLVQYVGSVVSDMAQLIGTERVREASHRA